MKYPLLPLCVMLSLLTGCSASARPLSTQLPTLEPDASPSSSPASTEYISPSASWWTHLDLNDLPSQKVDVTDQLPQEELFLLDELPEDDVSLYGYLSAGDTPSGILLRHGATYTHFDQVFLSENNPIAPQLWWMDPDGDGDQELAVYYVTDNNSSVFRSEFHLYEVSEEGWSDHALLPDTCQAVLLDALSCRWTDDGVTIQVGKCSLAFCTDELSPSVAQNAPLTCGDRIFYRYDRGTFTGVYTIGFSSSDGEPVHVASLLADIAYDGSNITLTNLRLEGYYGV